MSIRITEGRRRRADSIASSPLAASPMTANRVSSLIAVATAPRTKWLSSTSSAVVLFYVASSLARAGGSVSGRRGATFTRVAEPTSSGSSIVTRVPARGAASISSEPP
jgi:hypothetical protein